MMRPLLILGATLAGATSLWSQEPCWIGTADLVGQRGTDRVIQKSFDDLRVCVLGRDLTSASQLPPGEWARSSPRVILETQLGGRVHRMRFAADSVTFERDGSPRAIDSSATRWRAALVDVLNTAWQLDRLRKRDSLQRADDAPSGGQGGGAQGIAYSVPGELGAMRAELSSLKAEWSTLANEITALRAEVNRLSADLRSEQASMHQAQSRLAYADARERAAINRELQRYSREISRLDAAMQRAATQARARESQLTTGNIPGRVAKLERQILETMGSPKEPGPDEPAKDLDVGQRVAEVDRLLQAEIARTARDLDAFMQAALQRLRAAIRAD